MKALKSILLVDDDETTNFINESLFRKLKISKELVIKNNGKEALEYLTQKKDIPELILFDINMPIMDGMAFLNALQKLNLYFKIYNRLYALSSYNPLTTHDLPELSCNFVSKPLTQEKIIKILQSIE